MNSDLLKHSAGWLLSMLLGLSLITAQAQTGEASTATGKAAPALTTSAPAPAGLPLDGIWKGPLKVPGGQLDVVFRLLKLSSGDYFATLDVPQQKVSRMAVKVQTYGDTVRFIAEEANTRFVGRMATEGKQLVGNWQQPGFTTPITLSFAAPPALTDKNIRLTPPYREEEITFSNPAADLRLSGQLTLPPGAGPFPAVVLLSDAGPHDRNGTVNGFAPLGQLADYLTRRGIAVLRYDDRSVGKSTGQPGATTAELVTDAQAGLNFLRIRPEIDVNHIGLIGHGEGGNVALLAASQPLPPAFVVTLAAIGLPGAELLLQQHTAKLRASGVTGAQLNAVLKQEQAMLEIIRQTPDNAQAQAIVANMLRQSNPSLNNALVQASAAELVAARYQLSFNPTVKLTGVTCPVLLLHGTDDASDADSNLDRLHKGLSLSRKVTDKKLPGVNHLFQANKDQWPIMSGQPQPVFSPLAENTIREWIVAQAKK